MKPPPPSTRAVFDGLLRAATSTWLRLDVHNFAHEYGLSQEMRRTYPIRHNSLVVLVAALIGAQAARRGRWPLFCQDLRQRLVRGGGQRQRPISSIDAHTGKRRSARARRARARPLASNTKIFTTGDRALATSAPTTGSRPGPRDGKSIATGVLHGDLYLQGGGDPVLGSPAFYDALPRRSRDRPLLTRAQIASRRGSTR